MKTIVCFGDSNTWGYDPETNARAAFRAVLGTSEQTFTRDWLSYLDQLAHQ